MSDPGRLIQTLAIWALPVLFAVTLHEVSHGWAARYFGDHTAEQLGRLSLNPIKHIDPVGTIVVPALMLMFSGFIFGWAKPVPVVADNMRRPRKNMAVVALAGPAANLVMALIWALVLKTCLSAGGSGFIVRPLTLMANAGILINLVLMILNMVPIPPLDGSRVLNGVLPEAYARMVDRIEPYGLIILIVLLVSGALGQVLTGPLSWMAGLIYHAVGLGG